MAGDQDRDEKVMSDEPANSNPQQRVEITPQEVARADFELLKSLRSKLLTVLDEVDKGFKRVMLMYTIAFFAGVGIVLFSVVSTVINGSNVFTLIFGAVGVLDVVAFFVFRPAEDLQKSRANLAQLVAAFMMWNNDMRTWADVKRKMVNSDTNDINALHDISKRMMINTVGVMMAIDIFVEGKQMEEDVKRFQDIIKIFQDGIQTK